MEACSIHPPRASALSPLLGAFHLHEIDAHFAKQPHLYYARYMDDFIILTKTRWHLRRAIRQLNAYLAAYGFKTHPDKTFMGPIEKGFDWMGFGFTHWGCTQVAPRALNNHRQQCIRLYEQIRKLPTQEQAIRMRRYVTKWIQWRDNTFNSVITSTKSLLEGLQPK
ncbi:reverse transcriptase domain-containing protein [Vibrio metoecus]|uniref:reverse transcriptase domain-containing protein n=1 Tax=Vibrio metoecus TaxID=1481663 RepID=UPI003BF84AC7